jgi:pyruvate kinase
MSGIRKTNIICTLGPATSSPEVLTRMIQAGADIFRLNMSHAKHQWVRDIVPLIRSLAEACGRHVAILMDTQGPAIRTGDVATALELNPGDIFEFTVRGEKSEETYSVDVNYDGLIDDIAVGDTVLVDNGVIHLLVLEKKDNRIKCKVLTEGTLGSRRHINLPGVKVNLPALTPKDLEDIAVGAEVNVDWVALSFARDAEHITQLREALERLECMAKIIAKIEDQSAIKNVDEIIKVSDCVMVARGDLGVECPLEELPILQRMIVERCIHKNTPVIVATHMLESMIENPRPTRAEVTDVANAVFEQADCIMLSGETSVGKYPVECIQVLDLVARRMEREPGAGFAKKIKRTSAKHITAHAAVTLANSYPNSKIVVFTRHGTTAQSVANLRPATAEVHAFTPSEEVCRILAMLWGTRPHKLEFSTHPNKTIKAAIDYLKSQNLVDKGDPLVVISDVIAGEDRVDSIQLRWVE